MCRRWKPCDIFCPLLLHVTCGNESAVHNPVIRAAREISFLTGKKAAAEKPCRLGGKNRQRALPLLRKEEENQIVCCSSYCRMLWDVKELMEGSGLTGAIK